ncbi:MAG: integron [Beijerinckiaceae bacterium]
MPIANRRPLLVPAFAAIVLAAASLPLAAAGPASTIAVFYGGEAGLDACAGLGHVVALKRGGDNFLSVRGGPATSHREIDRLKMGQHVSMCDERGDWIGIVYTKSGQRCGVGTPVARRQPYRGPCRSGWVHRDFVELLAG